MREDFRTDNKENLLMRKPINAGNWKMHMLKNDAKNLINGICELVCSSNISKDVLPEVVVAPTFTTINTAYNTIYIVL